uniref:ATP synthase F0 subunit 8 n=1 Tax=Nuttallina californica TaxID=413430 RepID=A0A0E3DE75_9MOLL|nr:ATP synthase F0 subunit 8 [Nuttallina californica]AIA77067.1 ATP synthase F0 subunit 8 [Nuttallina californica]
MPQLAPMNWILLLILFWTSVIIMSMWLWWMSSKKYALSKPLTPLKLTSKKMHMKWF